MKKLFLVAFVLSGLAFVPVQRSDAQIEIGIPGIGTGPGVNYGYPHFEYGYYPRGGITTSNPTMGTTEDRHTIRITGLECIPVTTVIICIKPRWAQSARFDEITLSNRCVAFHSFRSASLNAIVHSTFPVESKTRI